MTLSNKPITFTFYYKDEKELEKIMKSVHKFMPKVFEEVQKQ